MEPSIQGWGGKQRPLTVHIFQFSVCIFWIGTVARAYQVWAKLKRLFVNKVARLNTYDLGIRVQKSPGMRHEQYCCALGILHCIINE